MAQEDDMASTLTRAVLAELEALRAQVADHDKALRPAFAPAPRVVPVLREDYAPRSWCGEGDCRPATPCQYCQGAKPGEVSPRKTGDPWAADGEHTDAFMARAADPLTPLSALRSSTAWNQQMAAAQRAEGAAPQVMWQAVKFCSRPECRPATPCGQCTGQLTTVADKSGETFGGRAQRTLTHYGVPDLGTDNPGYISPSVGAIGTSPIGGPVPGRQN